MHPPHTTATRAQRLINDSPAASIQTPFPLSPSSCPLSIPLRIAINLNFCCLRQQFVYSFYSPSPSLFASQSPPSPPHLSCSLSLLLPVVTCWRSVPTTTSKTSAATATALPLRFVCYCFSFVALPIATLS